MTRKPGPRAELLFEFRSSARLEVENLTDSCPLFTGDFQFPGLARSLADESAKENRHARRITTTTLQSQFCPACLVCPLSGRPLRQTVRRLPPDHWSRRSCCFSSLRRPATTFAGEEFSVSENFVSGFTRLLPLVPVTGRESGVTKRRTAANRSWKQE